MKYDNLRVKEILFFESVVVLLCVEFAFFRSFFFINTITISIIICALVLCIVSCFVKYNRIEISIIVFLAVLQALLIIVNSYYLYSKILIIMTLIAFFLMMVLSYNCNAIVISLWGILVFSIVNCIVNIVNIIAPNMYFKIISLVLSPSANESVRVLYYKNGLLCGLSSHYSRNAYYCVAGLLALFALLWSGYLKKKNRFIIFTIIVFEFALLLRIGKRGHLLFLVVSVIFVYLMMQKGVYNKIKKGVFFLLICILIGAILLYFIPDVGFVFERIAKMGSSKDISTGRFSLYKKAFEMFKNKPIFGCGYGSFTTTAIVNGNSNYAGVHNDYLQWLCELGIVGFVINVLFTFYVYYIGFKELKIICNDENSSKLDKLIIIWAMLFQTFVVLYSLTGLPHYDYEINTVYYMSCGAILGLNKKKKGNCFIKYYIIKLSGR